jgi:hypothetical protein
MSQQTADDSSNDEQKEYDPTIRSYREYRDRIEIMVEGIEETHEQYGDEPDYYVEDAIWEEVDSSGLTFKTYQALRVLVFADTNPQPRWEDYVDPNDSTWANYICAMAHTIVDQDVRKMLQRRGNIEEL